MAEQTKRQPGNAARPQTKGYELGDAPPSTEPRRDLERLQRPARWCPACGCDLTLVDEPPCPRCERPFIPGDTATYSTEPVEVKHRYWTDSQRLAGYIMLPLFLLGRSIISGVAPQWATMIDGGSGGSTASIFASVTMAVLMVLLIIPWLITTALLGLVALGDRYNPRLIYCLMIGGGLGLTLAMGMAPVILLVGLICGLFAGYLRCWLARI